MKVSVLRECGYEESALGFSLSYNSTIERAKELLPAFACKQGGENKFLESIYVWLDVTAPRFWWQEADTYRMSTKQSESTMHTLMKKGAITEDMFEHTLPTQIVYELQEEYNWLKTHDTINEAQKLVVLKNMLPEGFLQRRIWVMSYKTLQNIVQQRMSHRLPQWKEFIHRILNDVEHPEFLQEGRIRRNKMSEYLESLDLYLPAFTEEMEERFKEKAIKYGDTWKHRPVEPDALHEHQNIRFMDWMVMAFDKWLHGGEEINWVDVANEALICWVRENELGEELPIDKE